MRYFALLLLLCFASGANAANQCGTMLVPPTALHAVSRGFSHGHTGIDLMAPWGSPVQAAADGTIVYAGWYFAYGRIVDIQHPDGLVTRYAHMADFAPGIRPGVPVAAGQIIGRVGATGRAHGAHVHFEVRSNGGPIDPRPFLALSPCVTPPFGEPLEVAAMPTHARRGAR